LNGEFVHDVSKLITYGNVWSRIIEGGGRDIYRGKIGFLIFTSRIPIEL
jgi:hypothetical protein